MVGRVALTGTPGTGKSSVAALLSARLAPTEVSDLALSVGAGRQHAGFVEVDLARLRRTLFGRGWAKRPRVVVGHLAHLLPVHDAVVLRCHPLELRERLDRSRRGTLADRAENVVVEATDGILVECLRLRRRVWEVDTTHRTPADVAREVDRLIARRPLPRYGDVDWLADPRVTDYLLRFRR